MAVLVATTTIATAHDPSSVAPVASAAALPAAPVLDGVVIGDPIWEQVEPTTGFTQTTPDEGAPATEATEVRIGFSAETLYFGVICYDREPQRIIVADSRRDSSLDETDSFQLMLDTFLDRQNGFVFGTNPAGVEYDAQVIKEGPGGGFVDSGAGGSFNLNWDAAWEVRTQVGAFGWSIELAIPFRTLRYAGGGAQSWGLNFQRNIRRRNESAFWAPLSRQYNLYRVSLAGTLQGLDLPPQRNLKLNPYLLVEARRRADRGEETEWDGEVGGDLKYSLTPSLTLDATVNTDFAQVEVDEQQINLDRFNLFFPEKRPFFLENAGQFSVGNSEELEIFFSRRIGIGPDGEVVPILAGSRLSGRVGAFNLGLLNMQTRTLEGVTPANNFTVARLNRELPNRSSIGALFTNRQGTGDSAPEDDTNRAYAFDARWGIGRYGLISGFVAGTSTPQIESDDYAFNAAAGYSSPAWDLSAKYTQVGAGFNPEVGFLSRTDYRKPELLALRRIRPRAWLGLQELRPHISYRGFWKPDGFQESGFLHLDSHWEWKNGHEIHTGFNLTHEGVLEPFDIVPGVRVPIGTYEHREAQLVVISNQGAPLSFDGTFIFGGLFGGERKSLQPAIRARAGERFNAELEWIRNDIDLPAGSFITNLLRIRLSYSFNPRRFVQALLQYNDRDQLWSTNLRFGWLQSSNTGLFVVFNQLRDTSDTGLGERDRSLIVKYSYLFDVLN